MNTVLAIYILSTKSVREKEIREVIPGLLKREGEGGREAKIWEEIVSLKRNYSYLPADCLPALALSYILETRE